MKALRIKLYQETASYTKPFAFKVGETYPLPPYSTVIGMFHRVLKAETYHEMKISIQGTYEEKLVDYRSSFLYKKDESTKNKKDESAESKKDESTEKYKEKSINKSPLNIHLLFGVKLLIHVLADEETLSKIECGLKENDEFLSLGRKEDLVRIDEVKWVSIYLEEADHHHTLTYDIYVPIFHLQNEETRGIRYHLNAKYEVFNGIRIWEKVPVLYLSAGDHLEEEQYLKDEEGNIIYFHTP